MQKFMRKLSRFDFWLLLPYLILCSIGVVMVYSASAVIRVQTGGSPTTYLIKQTIYALIGFAVAFLVYNMNLEWFRNRTYLRDGMLLLLGALLFVKGFGASVNGAQGWINLGVISIQPAEFVKFYLITYLAHIFTSYKEYPENYYRGKLWNPVIICGLFVALILVQPDTGGAAINVVICFVLFLAGVSQWKVASTIVAPAVGLIIVGLPMASSWLANHLSGYKVARFVAYLNPFGTASGAGSQLVNSYYAISNGGLTGVGLGNSIQKMGYLPEPNTDFILAVIAEELGFVTVALILILLAIIICRAVLLGARTNNVYEGLICYGVATFICVETAFNVGAVSGLLPITGVTLPFISYGGSSMIVLSASLGLVLNVSRRQRERNGLKGAVANV